jgi:glycosyltransferase involved in cell wall biosynthesis
MEYREGIAQETAIECSNMLRLTKASANTRKFRFGFILSTSLGNATRYRTLRKYAERDSGVECTWAPVKHFFAPGEQDPVALVPRPFYKRAVVINQAWPVLGRMHQFDAVMIHQLEVLSLAALRSLIRPRPPVFAAQDNPPIVDPENYPLYPEDLAKPQWRRKLRLAADLWTARHTPYFVTFSHWQAEVLVQGCGIAAERVTPVHVGMDLELWPAVGREVAATPGPIRLLFVGAEFERKGGTRVLELFANGMFPRMTLDLVTRTPPSILPAGVTVHDDLVPGDGRIQRLYANADILVLPTTSDLSPWVCLEALACGCPVIASAVGGIPDMVRHGGNGLLVAPDDRAGLRQAIEVLAGDPARRAAMGAAGRRIVESDFDASRNVPRILEVMKQAARARKSL